MPALLSRSSLTLYAFALLLTACGTGNGGCASEAGIDGVYRLTTSAADLGSINAPGESPESWGTWTLVLDRRRFAITRENGHACTWAYGALSRAGQRMYWRILDAGGTPPRMANEPADRYGFRWSRYRDLLTLHAVSDAPAGYFAAKPWRRIEDAPSAGLLSRRCSPPRAALVSTGVEDVTPRSDLALGFGGDFTRTSRTTWTARGDSKELGPGRMTISGRIVFGYLSRTRVTFTLHTGAGTLGGCQIMSVIRRPHARYVWDGSGQVTAASSGLRRYLALPVGFGGVTSTHDLEHLHGGVGTFARGRASAAHPDILC